MKRRKRSKKPAADAAGQGASTSSGWVLSDPTTRLTLLWRIRNLDDATSWAEFAQRYNSFMIARAMARGMDPSTVHDAIQLVLLDVARSIQTFEHSGKTNAFRNWLGNLVGWRSRDLLRAQRRFFSTHLLLPTDLADTLLLEGSDLTDADEAAVTAEVRRELLTKALRRVRDRMEAKTYRAFELVALKGKAPRDAAQETGMTRSSVYVAKSRAIDLLREEISRLQRNLN